jgi:hypothetical protein
MEPTRTVVGWSRWSVCCLVASQEHNHKCILPNSPSPRARTAAKPGILLSTFQIDYDKGRCLTWQQLTEKHYRTCADLQEATEYGAYGIAILVVRETTGKTVLERSAKGPGFDFWIGDEEDTELPFQGLMRLEVSGILTGDTNRIACRAQRKKMQVSPSDEQAPALIAIVEFGRPLTLLEQK